MKLAVVVAALLLAPLPLARLRQAASRARAAKARCCAGVARRAERLRPVRRRQVRRRDEAGHRPPTTRSAFVTASRAALADAQTRPEPCLDCLKRAEDFARKAIAARSMRSPTRMSISPPRWAMRRASWVPSGLAPTTIPARRRTNSTPPSPSIRRIPGRWARWAAGTSRSCAPAAIASPSWIYRRPPTSRRRRLRRRVQVGARQSFGALSVCAVAVGLRSRPLPPADRRCAGPRRETEARHGV